ncbi:GNAT family N-acetyltransferase [Flavobacterium sp.]|uniref:GNAT family N-acetyltransferase n=1 Tax=Flavobacterium sp. TaxID=239 RepID=UPI003D6AD42E
MEYSIQPFTEDRLDDFRLLYKEVYGKSIPLEFVLKKFDSKYLIDDYFGYFAYDNSKPIAFYGVVPVLMHYKNQTEIGAQSVNTMTHPDYNGKGLFTKLAALTYAKMEQSGITFLWGFPNENSAHAFLNKLGGKSNEQMMGYSIPASKYPIQNGMQKIPFIRIFYKSYLKKIFEKHITEKTLKGSIPEDYVSVCRNKAYYNYKTFSDNFNIVLEDCFFWIKIKNGLEIGDVEASSEENFNKAMQSLKQICKKAGIQKITFQTSPGTLPYEWMKNQKSIDFKSWLVGYKNLGSHFPLEKLKFTLGDVDTF